MEATEQEIMNRMMVQDTPDEEDISQADEDDQGLDATAEADDDQETDQDQEAETDEDTEAEPEPAPAKYTVKVDGKEVAVTLEELTRDYSGQAYIQKGMQEAAEARKASAELLQTLQTQQAEFLAVVQQVQQQGFKAPPKAPDYAMAQTDPIGFLQAKAAYDMEMSEYQAQQQQIGQLTAKQQEMQSRAMSEYLAEQAKILQAEIPELADAQKAGEFQTKLRKTGAEYGFNDTELDGITDARHVKVLRDAMKWRELQAGKASLAPKLKAAPRSVTPGSKRAEPAELAAKRQLEKARKSGQDHDFAAYLLNR